MLALAQAAAADPNGILPLLDPPRPDAKKTIEQAEALSLSVKMVTGDDVAIGGEISRQLGLGSQLLVASDVFGANPDPENITVDAAWAVHGAQPRVYLTAWNPPQRISALVSIQEVLIYLNAERGLFT